jgi:hypothetical protein
MSACVSMVVGVRESGRVNVRKRACSLPYPTCKMNAPYLLSFLSSLSPPYFLTLLHKRHEFREKVTKLKMCGLIFCTPFV